MSEEGHDVDEGEVLPVEAYKDELMVMIVKMRHNTQ